MASRRPRTYSRRTTSVACTASSWTATRPRRSVARSRSVLVRARGQARVRAARGSRPRHALDRARAGGALSHRALEEGADVIDAGQVGTEMLYYLVGSRELDGGLMCTASHNPAAYTGAKLVRDGAIALSGDAGIQDIRAAIEAGLGRSLRAAARPRTWTCTESSRSTRCGSSTRDRALPKGREGKPLKVVVDGGNGMAGPMVGPLLRAAGAGADRDLLDARRRRSPTTSPTRCWRRTASRSSPRCARAAPISGIAWDGDADRCFFIDDTGAFVDGDFLTALLARVAARQGADGRPPEAVLYDVRASRAVARHGARRRRHAARQPRRARLLQDAHARGGLAVRRGGLRALLLPRVLLRRLGHDPGAADPRAAGSRGPLAVASCSRRCARSTSSRARSTRRSPTPRRRWRRSPSATPTRARTRLDGISIDYEDWHFNVRPSNTEPLLRLCLESLRLARGHGAPPRRGARADPLVSDDGETEEPDEEELLARAAAAGIHRLAIPTPFQVGRVNAYLIEDSPLTLIDSGPNSGKLAATSSSGRSPRAGTRSRTSSCSSSPTSTSTTSGSPPILARRSGAEVAALDRLAPYLREFDSADRAGRRVRPAGDAAPRHPAPTSSRALRAVSAQLSRVGRGRGGHAAAARRRGAARCATAPCACCTGPATARRTRCSGDDASAQRSCSPPTTCSRTSPPTRCSRARWTPDRSSPGPARGR